jgi:hypothetical protein
MENLSLPENADVLRPMDEALLLCLPVFALTVGFGMALYESSTEPWPVFHFWYAAIQVGGLLVAIASALTWTWQIIRKRRPIVLLLLPVLALGLLFAGEATADYFSQPWTYLPRR